MKPQRKCRTFSWIVQKTMSGKFSGLVNETPEDCARKYRGLSKKYPGRKGRKIRILSYKNQGNCPRKCPTNVHRMSSREKFRW